MMGRGDYAALVLLIAGYVFLIALVLALVGPR
jgi:hypothetical protein